MNQENTRKAKFTTVMTGKSYKGVVQLFLRVSQSFQDLKIGPFAPAKQTNHCVERREERFSRAFSGDSFSCI